jgi:small subunit ribosomal protein S6
MTLPPPTYDLVLLLDPEAEDATRAKIIADAKAAIEAQGEFLRHDEWGDRTLAYPIDRKAVAEYHLLQFHAGAPQLLDALTRTLRITDGIMRFRVVKLKPGVPDAPSAPDSTGTAAAPDATAAEPRQEPAAAAAPGVQEEIVAEDQAAPQDQAAVEGEVVIEGGTDLDAELDSEQHTEVGGPA